MIASYNPKTGAFPGIDNAWDIGKEKVVGELHGDTVTMTVTYLGVVIHDRGTLKLGPHGQQTWAGNWNNSIGQSGTWYATRKV